MRYLQVLFGETDGSSTSGVFKLYDKLVIYGTPPNIWKLDPHVKLRIKQVNVSGKPVTVSIEFCRNYEDDTTCSPVDKIELASEGELSKKYEYPLVLRARNGSEGFRITWSQETAAKSYIMLVIEWSDEDGD